MAVEAVAAREFAFFDVADDAHFDFFLFEVDVVLGWDGAVVFDGWGWDVELG